MKDTTKLYLFMGMLYYPVIAIGSYDPRAGQVFGYFLGGIMLGFLLGMHKLFILQELRQKKLEQYEEMINGMADYFEQCKEEGKETPNLHIYDGKEIKKVEDVIKEKQESNFSDCEDGCCKNKTVGFDEFTFLINEEQDNTVLPDSINITHNKEDKSIVQFRTLKHHMPGDKLEVYLYDSKEFTGEIRSVDRDSDKEYYDIEARS